MLLFFFFFAHKPYRERGGNPAVNKIDLCVCADDAFWLPLHSRTVHLDAKNKQETKE